MNNREIIHEANNLKGFKSNDYGTFTNSKEHTNIPKGYVSFDCPKHGEFQCLVPEIFFKTTVWLQFEPEFAARKKIRENIRYPLIYIPENVLPKLSNLKIFRRNSKVAKEFNRVRKRADSNQYDKEKAELHFIFAAAVHKNKIDAFKFIKRAILIV